MNGDSEHVATLVERLGRLVYTDAHAEGLLPVQWETLRFLQRANRFSRTPAAVTAYLGLTKGTVSQTLNTLQARGLIEKQVNGKDRRSRRLLLTGAGQRLLDEDPLARMARAIDSLTAARRKALATDLARVLSTRLTAQDRVPFGQCASCRHFSRRHAQGQPHFCQLLNEPLSAADSAAICVEQVPAA